MKNEKKKPNHKHSALSAASIARSATAQVERHRDHGFANTGTNISYEGATAPGAGGSVGAGYASGKAADDETISTNSDFVQNRGSKPTKNKHKEDPESNDADLTDDDFYVDENF